MQSVEITSTSNDLPGEIAKVIKLALGGKISANNASFLDSFTDDLVIEFPFAPEPQARRIEGKKAARAFFSHANKEIAIENAALDKTYEASGSASVVMEYHAITRNRRTGKSFPQHFIAIVELANGRITNLREYFGPAPSEK